jgi:hypothetical protein
MSTQAFGSNNRGCSDIICPGFVQVTQDKKNALGSISSPNTAIGASTKLTLPVRIQRVTILFMKTCTNY